MKKKKKICEEVASGLSKLFECSEQGEYYRIRTPYLYPDGDNIDLFCKESDGIIVISDLGETTRWLRMQTTSLRRSSKQKALIDDICLNHNVEFYKGMLIGRCRQQDELASILIRVAQAALRVSDLWFTFRTRSVESVNDEVADFLIEKHFQYERGEKRIGRSGRSWNVDFHVRTLRKSSLVYVLSTGSKSLARNVAEHVLAAWYDMHHLSVGPEGLNFVSLFDDTADVWSEEDFKLVESLSTVARWSKPDEFANMLIAA